MFSEEGKRCALVRVQFVDRYAQCALYLMEFMFESDSFRAYSYLPVYRRCDVALTGGDMKGT